MTHYQTIYKNIVHGKYIEYNIRKWNLVLNKTNCSQSKQWNYVASFTSEKIKLLLIFVLISGPS